MSQWTVVPTGNCGAFIRPTKPDDAENANDVEIFEMKAEAKKAASNIIQSTIFDLKRQMKAIREA